MFRAFSTEIELWETVGKIDLALTDFSSAKCIRRGLEAYDKIENKDPVRRLALLENVGALCCGW